MDRTLLVGPGGSGRTRRLMEIYQQIARQHSTDNILVLLRNARDVRDWREGIDLPWAGPLHVYTYFGWIQRELRRYWPRTDQWLEPEFLTVETGQFTMLEQVDKLADRFAPLVTSRERLAIQLGSCLVLAALNGLDRRQIGTRLAGAAGADDEVYAAAQAAMNGYVEKLKRNGALDYALAVEAYRKLSRQHWYRRMLELQFRCLLVDDTDEMPPAAHDFIELLLEWCEKGVLVFATDGGHSSFFGADPKGAWQRFGRGKVELIRPCSWPAAGASLYAALVGGRMPQPCRGPELELIEQDLRSQMLEAVGDKVYQLVTAGVAPAEIAVLSPLADKVLEHVLATRLKREGVSLNVLTKNRRLIDQPYVRAMMTLAILAHSHWELDWGVPDLAQSLELLLKVDPVRAWLLSRQVRDFRLLPLEPWLRERVGFKAAGDYDLLRRWLEGYREHTEQPIDLFFQRVFGELLSRLPPARDDLVVCRQLMVSAQKFLRTARRFPDLAEQPGPAFIRMLSAGTVAAESLLEPETKQTAVVLSTPYAYISGHHRSRVQVWADCTSWRWFQQDSREVLNPHVLSRSWPQGERWSDQYSRDTSILNGARTVRALLRRCTGRLIAAGANVDSHGYEQDGPLLALLYEVLGEGGGGDAL